MPNKSSFKQGALFSVSMITLLVRRMTCQSLYAGLVISMGIGPIGHAQEPTPPPYLPDSRLALKKSLPLPSQGNSHLPLFNPGLYSQQQGKVDYAQNSRVDKIRVQVEHNHVPADGQTPVRLTISVLDKTETPVLGDTFVTVEVSGGRLQIPGATSDEFGPARADLDLVTPGTQIKALNGQVDIYLVAPFVAQDVMIQVTAGKVQAQGVISFVPELREMLAVGLVEGIIHFDRKSPLQLSRARHDDGFEQEIQKFSRTVDNSKRSHALRTAFFLKGKIKGEALLTMAYDSDKATYQRLFRDIRPDDYYPVYGDASIKGAEAQSTSSLYVRIDKDKSYLLWGDFNTGDGFSQFNNGAEVASLRKRDLGNYSRTLNGAQGHYDKEGVLLNGFVTKDTLVQFVEEFPGQGISGPFSVSKRDAVSGSEKLEVITRDRYQPAVILQVESLQRYGDYSFEPFSGRILLREPLPSIDVNGNPKSLRVTYEVESPAESFWIYGMDGQVKLGEQLELGGSYAHDKNPYAPYTLMSGNLAFYFSENTTVVAEIARSKSMLGNTLGKSLQDNPYRVHSLPGRTSSPDGQLQEVDGNAWRIEMLHQSEAMQARFYYGSSNAYFNNPAASLAQGRREGAAKLTKRLTDTWQLYTEIIHSEDSVADAQRDAGAIGGIYDISPTLNLDVALTHTKEKSGDFSNIPLSFGSGLQNHPQHSGDINSLLINPQTGYGINGASYGLAGVNYHSTGIRLRSTYHLTEKIDLTGEYERGLAGEYYHRAATGAAYRFSERGRVYGKYEWITGLSSPQATHEKYQANAFVLGMDTEYLPEQRLFSEYRMRDAFAGSDLQWATGLRNAWAVSETVKVATSAEYLQAHRGQTQGAYALTGAVEWRPDEVWLIGGRLEWRRTKDLEVSLDHGNRLSNETRLLFGSDTWLSMLTVARKINRDWTFLGRNYLLYTDNHGHVGNIGEDRLQLGLAYRDTATNRINLLTRYEYWIQRDHQSQLDAGFDKHIISLHADYHPSRAWWIDGRLAAKWQQDYFNDRKDSYSAFLLSGRLTYDITERWDVSGLSAIMYSPKGHSRQYAQGLEVGCQLQNNMWLSAGYNWRGFNDRDLIGADYTNQGFYVRLRLKFDEDLFGKVKSTGQAAK
jgi:hypothetical protein